jgi:hypothetical protein
MPPRGALAESEIWTPVVIPRLEFARSYFWYNPGEIVLFAGPTQRGKTSLAFVLLEYTATPQLPAYILVSKPRDKVTERETARLEYRRTDRWPVERKVKEVWDGPPAGYVIWPPFGNVHGDVQRVGGVHRAALEDLYSKAAKAKDQSKHQGIVVLDDTIVKEKLYGLGPEMRTYLTMAAAMGLGAWIFVQKPTGGGDTAIWGYGAAEHVFLFNDPDKRNRERYDEIGGVDPKQIAEIVRTQLDPYQCLYVKRTPQDGQQIMCIVDSK